MRGDGNHPHRVDRINALWKLTMDSERWINEWSINANSEIFIPGRLAGYMRLTNRRLSNVDRKGRLTNDRATLDAAKIISSSITLCLSAGLQNPTNKYRVMALGNFRVIYLESDIHIGCWKLIPQRTFKNAEFNSF